MARLPDDIMANIISHLAAEGISSHYNGDGILAPTRDHALAPYATVSRAWQQRIEAVTFAHVGLTPNRVRRFVRSVLVEVLLPPYGEEARGRREDEAERAIRLSMVARCVSDTDDLEARKRRWNVSPSSVHGIFERRYESSYLDLRPAAGEAVQDEAEALPQLHCIQEFHAQACTSPRLRYIAPRALCLMASRMPGLESVNWQLCDNEKRDVALRKWLRADFADALQALPYSLRDFQLLYDRLAPLDHSFQTPSILDGTGGDNNDRLSLALHKLSQRLTSFSLVDTAIGPEILWPSQRTAPDNKDPLWPRMRRYSIDPGPIAPSGKWSFQRDADASDYESDSSDSDVPGDLTPGNEREDPFREILDPDAANALLLAAARAARRMPALWKMAIRLDPPTRGSELEVEYTNNMDRAGPTRVENLKAELVVESHPVFNPDEEVVQAWRGPRRNIRVPSPGLYKLVVRDTGRRW